MRHIRNLALGLGLLAMVACGSTDEATETTDNKPSVTAADGVNKRRGRWNPERRVKRMQKRLGLSDEQAAKLASIMTSSMPRSERGDAIKAILTPDQLAEYEAMRSRRRGRRGRR